MEMLLPEREQGTVLGWNAQAEHSADLWSAAHPEAGAATELGSQLWCRSLSHWWGGAPGASGQLSRSLSAPPPTWELSAVLDEGQ